MQTRTHATLLTLQKGRTNLADLASAIRRAGHVSGQPGQFFAKGKDGESVFGFIGRGRYFDVLVDGIARESKVGFVKGSNSIENQIRKDGFLKQTNPLVAGPTGTSPPARPPTPSERISGYWTCLTSWAFRTRSTCSERPARLAGHGRVRDYEQGGGKRC